MKGQKPNCAALWYYNLSPKQSVTVRYQIQMKESVDGPALQRAVEVAMTRYPYMKKKVAVTPAGYVIEDNPLPIVVLNTKNPVPLCGSEANWHQIAISYFEDTIFFNNTHAICDGRGRSALLHTMMYYYCKFRYNEEIDMPGVNLVDSPIDPAEYADPFDHPIPESDTIIPDMPAPASVMHLADTGDVYLSPFYTHHLRVNEAQLMDLCKSSDGTPNTAVSLLMARGIAKLHPDTRDSIVAGVYCDVRKALGAPLSHHPLIETLALDFTPDMHNLSFEEQNTIFRGKMLLMTDDQVVREKQKDAKALADKINSLSTLEEKIELGQTALDTLIRSHTFLVSYSGKSSYGTCDKHIKALFPQTGTKDMGILMEITSADGWFYITFVQEWKEDIYFNAFIKELIDQGLEFDLLYSAQSQTPKFSPEK